MIIPDAAHGTNPASVRLAGFDAVRGARATPAGMVDVAALEALVDEQVAGLMLTNPNTLGLFEEDIERDRRGRSTAWAASSTTTARTSTRSSGGAGPGDMGFDIVHINTHKTFATPHGGGGPGAGPVGVKEHLVAYLPAPILRARRRRDASPGTATARESIGRLHGFNGNFGVLVRAYAYVFLHGADGLKEVSELAALNANYLAALIARRLPARVPGRASDARVRGDGQAAQGRRPACARWTWPSA